jgi:N-acetylmuramoyl-L-alanine amidase
MRHERSGPARPGRDSTDCLADTLFDLAGDQDVRVIEALAAVLARQRQEGSGSPSRGLCEAPAARPFASEPWNADDVRRAICRRIARRALHGSLVDPTRGATAVHRIDDSPVWARDLLPIGMFGPFLFYRPPAPRWRAGDSPGATHDGRQIVGLDW